MTNLEKILKLANSVIQKRMGISTGECEEILDGEL